MKLSNQIGIGYDPKIDQEEHFRKYGCYNHNGPLVSKEDALRHAMNQIERAFGSKRKK